jgi:hypothetical protein
MQPIAYRSPANTANIYLIVFPVLCNSISTALGAFIYHHSVRSEFLVVFIGGLVAGMILGTLKTTLILITSNTPAAYSEWLTAQMLESNPTAWGVVIVLLDFIAFSWFPFVVTPPLGNWLLNYHADIRTIFSDEIAGLMILFICLPCMFMSIVGCVLFVMMDRNHNHHERQALLNSNV